MQKFAVQEKKPGVVPAFTVEEGGEYTIKRATFNKEKKTFEFGEHTHEQSYILKFPRGHSIRVFSMEEVKRIAGDPDYVELVDLDTSDVHGVTAIPIKKARGKD